MNVQDKQQGQARPVGTTGFDARLQAGEPTRPEQAAPCQSRIETLAAFKADVSKALSVAADVAGTNIAVLTSGYRLELYCIMRQIAAYWLFRRGYSKRDIALPFNRDRSSIYHAVNRIEGLLAINDKHTTQLWQEFNEKITNYKEKKITTMSNLNDITGMPIWQQKREYLTRLLTNLTFEVADVLETLFVEMESVNAECGYQLHNEEKRHFKAAMHHVKAFRGATRLMDVESQESFGDDAEMLLDLIYAAVTRTGSDNAVMEKILTDIMQLPDRVGLDGVRQGGAVFEAIKLAQAEKRIKAYEQKQEKK